MFFNNFMKIAFVLLSSLLFPLGVNGGSYLVPDSKNGLEYVVTEMEISKDFFAVKAIDIPRSNWDKMKRAQQIFGFLNIPEAEVDWDAMRHSKAYIIPLRKENSFHSFDSEGLAAFLDKSKKFVRLPVFSGARGRIFLVPTNEAVIVHSGLTQAALDRIASSITTSVGFKVAFVYNSEYQATLLVPEASMERILDVIRIASRAEEIESVHLRLSSRVRFLAPQLQVRASLSK